MNKQIIWLKAHEKITGKEYGKSLPFYENRKQLEFIESFIPKKCKTLCDLGCGSGIVGLFIKRKRPNIQVTFIDANPKQLEAIPPEKGEIIQKDLLKYKPNKKFDCVVSRLVNHYFEKKDQKRVIKKVYDLLSVNGVYICVTPLADKLEDQKAINEFFYKLEKMVVGEKAIQRYILRKDEIKDLCFEVGFKSVKIYQNSCLKIKHFIDDFSKKFKLTAVQIRTLTRFLENLPSNIKSYFGLKKVNNRLKINYPLYLVIAKK